MISVTVPIPGRNGRIQADPPGPLRGQTSR